MSTLITETLTDEQLRIRQESGGDRYDEVWDGVYLMSPLANNEHQLLVGMLTAIFNAALDSGKYGSVYPGVNVSDREVDWIHNYRCPDVAVVLPGCPAKNCETHWCGGPDFLVEIVSEDDRSRQKLDFYAGVGVRELLVIDRLPWALELYRLQAGELQAVGGSKAESSLQLQSSVLPLNFRLIPADARPVIEVTHNDGRQTWRI